MRPLRLPLFGIVFTLLLATTIVSGVNGEEIASESDVLKTELFSDKTNTNNLEPPVSLRSSSDATKESEIQEAATFLSEAAAQTSTISEEEEKNKNSGETTNNNLGVYDPADSVSWRGNPNLGIRVTYGSGSQINGFLCSDLVQLGRYETLAPFCCIESYSGVIDGQGIAGFAPAPHPKPNEPPPVPPLFFSLSNLTGVHGNEGKVIPLPVFSFFATKESAELQLGGFELDSIENMPFFVDSLLATQYEIPVSSVRLGNVELVSFQNSNNSSSSSSSSSFVPALVDSGTSCMCFPDSLIGNKVKFSPYKLFVAALQNQATRESPIILTISGHQVVIPSSVWRPAASFVRGCVASCDSDRFVLGDWLFRSNLVTFDLRYEIPKIGFAKLNESYIMATSVGKKDTLRVPVRRHWRRASESDAGHRQMIANPRSIAATSTTTTTASLISSLFSTVSDLMGFREESNNNNNNNYFDDSIIHDGETLSPFKKSKVQMRSTDMSILSGASSVGAVNEDNLLFLIPISVGSPPRKLEVLFDTGSSLFAVVIKEDLHDHLEYLGGPHDVPRLGSAPLAVHPLYNVYALSACFFVLAALVTGGLYYRSNKMTEVRERANGRAPRVVYPAWSPYTPELMDVENAPLMFHDTRYQRV